MANPQPSIELLNKLEALGFTDEAYQLLHQTRVTGRRDSIASHRRYCAEHPSFQRDGDNERTQRRLEFVLRKYREGGYPPGRLDVFIELANRAFVEIPPSKTVGKRMPVRLTARRSRTPPNTSVEPPPVNFRPVVNLAMETEHTAFMRDLEARYQEATGLSNRSQYKIFYCQVRPAPVLTLGINPGGDPSKHTPDGRYQTDGRDASRSASFFENDEHDILDCEWKENTGLRKILVPLLGGDRLRIRAEVVKTNLAFHRSLKPNDINIEDAISESAPFLMEIMNRVQPSLVLLTTGKEQRLELFTERYFRPSELIVREKVKHIGVVFAAARVQPRWQDREVLLVQVAHSSRPYGTYEKYRVVDRIRDLLGVLGLQL